MNSVNLIGNLTAAPELRTTPGGASVTDFALAVNEVWRDKDGNKQETAHFIDCTAWGKNAEAICRFKGKGDQLAVTGKLRQDRWEDKESGKNRSKIKVMVETFTFTGKAPKAGQSASDEAADREAADREHNKRQFAKQDAETAQAHEGVPF
ncbi:MAG: single-stranded DNA-binding protein [Nitrospira sp.]|nr:single-stranded DNA-binding protein [Nitrospira sp.]